MSDTATWAGLLWALGAYVVGTFPSTYVVARARRGTEVIRASRREAGEADAHILMNVHLGGRWAAVAATADVLKAFVYVLLAREVAGLTDAWLALVGVAVVVGHGWPPYARAMAGRGLSATAGVFLVLLPIPMVVMGVVIVLGAMVHATSAMSTVGLLLVPIVAIIQGQPTAFVAMASAILLVILIRRLEGVGEVVRSGIPWYRAAYYRMVFDLSGPPGAEPAAEEERPANPGRAGPAS